MCDRHFLDLLKSRVIRADHRIQAILGIPVLGIWKFPCTFHFGLLGDRSLRWI
ncbi:MULTISPECIES: hypothetical protein [unclassified Nostoc]|uniref:hypothetical protein n=1 Tax=unclassified Nostoc TaxID=2593658 RepID=UPI002AD5A1DC|nr:MULTISPECIES: hypothetical protein [unclassified Nostoc]MDZ8126622.1 hypothetical protein [Nostoc sp. CmiVER01]MDZ8227847.1 hypothetical protein [Nostoc sp. ChiVER01]